MKSLWDMLNAVLFLVAYHYWDIWIAITAFMVSVLLQTVVCSVWWGKIDRVQCAVTALVLLLGALSLYLHDLHWFKWKPTVIYGVLSMALFVGPYFPVVQWRRYFQLSHWAGEQLQLPSAHWSVLQYAWGGFFLTLGILNAGVAHYCSTATWVYFKFFGIAFLFGVFLLGNCVYCWRFFRD